MDRTQQDAWYSQASAAHGAELRRLARGYESDPDLQRDLLQEIHLQLWKSLCAFDHRCSLRTWAFRVAHNVGATHLKRRMRSSARLVDLDALPGEDVPDASSEHRVTAGMLLDLIHRLKLPDRQIMLLYLEGEDAASIAEVTGLSAANVATKIHRIKKMLRQEADHAKT